MKVRPGVLALLVVAFSLAAEPAWAKFRVCNMTEHSISIAIGRVQAKAWVSEGWWLVKPKDCTDILRGALNARYYYLRGVHMGVDGAWEGNRFFCVAGDNFAIKGRGNCAKRGYGEAGFFEIDTGAYSTWVQNLSD